jgi:hypothetical protein
MTAEAISDLETFNDKAAVLLSSTFMDKVRNEESGVSFHWDRTNGAVETLKGPEGESVSSALFTLRMFMQNNDRISIGNIGKIYSVQPKLTTHNSEYEIIKKSLNYQLDVKAGFDFFGKNYTFREALDVYLYATGHTNRQKTEELKKITSAPLASSLFKNIVNVSIGTIGFHIESLVSLNEKALLELR